MIDMINKVKHGKFHSFRIFTKKVEEILILQLNYHGKLMDIDSIRNNILGIRVIQKSDGLIVKSNSGNLYSPKLRITDSEIEEVISYIQQLKDVTERNGIKFLYCVAPAKDVYVEAPRNIINHGKIIHEKFLLALKSSQIPTLNFEKVINDNNISKDNDIFYNTDHHWRAYIGFLACSAICEELSLLYGFSYNKEYTNLDNYNITHYPHLFLGSYGRKTGPYFSWHGADDFELIIPKFETSLIEEKPIKNHIREGKFEDTVLYLSHMKKNYYHDNPYNTYGGGDDRFQLVRNNINPNGEKILLVRDSFANVVTPFLSLQVKELHICDMRDFGNYTEKKINLESYMKEIQPDYVIVLYNSIFSKKNSKGKYDFF